MTEVSLKIEEKGLDFSNWPQYTILFLTLALAPLSGIGHVYANVIISLIGVFSLIYLWKSDKLYQIKETLFSLVPLLAFILFAFSSIFWSLNFKGGVYTSFKLLSYLLLGGSLYTIMKNLCLKRFMKFLTLGYVIVLVLHMLYTIKGGALLHFFRPGKELYNFNRSLVLLSFLVWPLLSYYINSKKRLFSLFFLTLPFLVFIIYTRDFHTAKLSLFAAFIAWGLCLTVPRLFIKGLAIGSAALIFSFPWLVNAISYEDIVNNYKPLLIKPSYHHRVAILKRSANLITESPYIGQGINSFVVNDYEKNDDFLEKNVHRLAEVETHPLAPEEIEQFGKSRHPHNAILELWFELGFIGILLFVFFLVRSLWLISSAGYSRLYLAGFSGFYVTAFIMANNFFSIWNSWLFDFIFALSLQLAIMNHARLKKDSAFKF